MSSNTFYLANRLFSMKWSMGAIARHLELTEDERTDVAFFLCEKHGVETVFPQGDRARRSLAAA